MRSEEARIQVRRDPCSSLSLLLILLSSPKFGFISGSPHLAAPPHQVSCYGSSSAPSFLLWQLLRTKFPVMAAPPHQVSCYGSFSAPSFLLWQLLRTKFPVMAAPPHRVSCYGRSPRKTWPWAVETKIWWVLFDCPIRPFSFSLRPPPPRLTRLLLQLRPVARISCRFPSPLPCQQSASASP